MQIQVNTDSSLPGDGRLQEYVKDALQGVQRRFRDHVTRVEVHLSDENGEKHGADDKRCTMEARVRGLAPVAVTHHADNVRNAISGATDKLEHALDSVVGRRKDHRA